MRILIKAKGLVSVSSWNNDVLVNEESLSKQISEAIRSTKCPEKSFATVTVELLVQEPVGFNTHIDGATLSQNACEEEETE